jgi:putative flippase GtrA
MTTTKTGTDTTRQGKAGAFRRLFRWAVANEKVRYLVVGGFNVAAWSGYFVLFQLWLGDQIGYMGSLGAAYVLSNLSGFFLHRYVVFQVRQKFLLDLARFTLVQVGSFFANAALLILFVEVVGLPPIPAQAIVVVIMVTVNFVAHKFFSFRRAR